MAFPPPPTSPVSPCQLPFSVFCPCLTVTHVSPQIFALALPGAPLLQLAHHCLRREWAEAPPVPFSCSPQSEEPEWEEELGCV